MKTTGNISMIDADEWEANKNPLLINSKEKLITYFETIQMTIRTPSASGRVAALLSVIIPDEELYKVFLGNLISLSEHWPDVHFGFFCDLPTRQIDLTAVYHKMGNSTEAFLETFANCDAVSEETEEDPINLEMD